MRLVPSDTGTYEVLFGFPDGWEQYSAHVVEAPDPHGAVVEAYRRGGWLGAPNRGAGAAALDLPPVQPIFARVRYQAINPNAGAKTAIERCARHTGTQFCAMGSVFERLPVFRPTGLALDTREGWVHATEGGATDPRMTGIG